jgi:hypothetical protein
MTDKQFLPEYSFLLSKGRYVPMFRLFVGEAWKYGKQDGQQIQCDSASQAIMRAKEIVARILNPPLRSEQMVAEAAVPDFLDAAAWRREKEAEAAAERKSLLTAEVLFLKGNRQVTVERRRARA